MFCREGEIASLEDRNRIHPVRDHLPKRFCSHCPHSQLSLCQRPNTMVNYLRKVCSKITSNDYQAHLLTTLCRTRWHSHRL